MKFLRGKIWQIALAVCLLVVLLCITASAEDDSMMVKLQLGAAEYEITQGQTLYFTTDDSGNVTQSTVAIEGSYNIKLEFGEGKDAVPTMYMRDAYISQFLNSNYRAIKGIETTASKFLIIVERVDAPRINNADFSWANIFEWTISDLEIRGYKGDQAPKNPDELGRVYSKTSFNCMSASKSYTVTFTGVHVTMLAEGSVNKNTGNIDARACIQSPKQVVFDGGTVHMTSRYKGAIDNVSRITVEAGDVTLVSENQRAINGDGTAGLVVNGGTLTLQADKSYVIENIGDVNVSGYENSLRENYCYISSIEKGEGTEVNEYVASTGANQKYLKVEPAYAVTVTNGESDRTSYPVGATVTLTPADKGEIVFDKWVVADDSAKIEIKEENGEYTFVMPEGNVKVTADYIEKATISLAGTDYTFTEGEDLYFETDSNGGVTKLENVLEGTVPEHQIKLGFVKEVPTVFLKDAYISSSGTTIKGSNFAINTESPSSIAQTGNTTNNSAAIAVTGKLTFTGSALLSVEGKENVIYGTSAQLEFAGANVKLDKTEGITWGDAAISGSVSEITFSGGTVNIDSSYMALYCGIPTVTVQKGAIVIVECGTAFSWDGTYITVNDSTMNIRATNGNYRLFDGSESGKCTLAVANGGELEITSAGKILHIAPDLSNYQGEYYAVMGADVSTATKYNGTDALSGKYFRIGKKATVTVTDGTAKAFGVSSTATESTTHVLETMIGANVTLTAGTAPDGKTFFKWVDTTSGETFTGVNAATGTFTATQNVNVTAIFGKQASVTIAGTPRSVFQGYDALYFTTTDGTVALGGDERTYNIKFVYPTGDGATPKLYLRGAYLTQTITSNANTVIGTKIVVEKVGEYPTTVPKGIEADSYITVGIKWGAYDLTISGYEGAKENPTLAEIGKLKMATGGAKCVDANAGYEITYKDLNLEVTTTGYAIGQSTKFDGGKASVVSEVEVYMIWASADSLNTTHKGITVTGGADVTFEGSRNTICIYYSTSAKITVEKDSKLKVVSRTSQAIRAPEAQSSENVLSVNGGTLEVSGTKAGYSGTVVRPTGYDGNYFVTIDTTTTSATAVSLNSYAYFKVEPAYTLSVTEGTASVKTDRVTVANATKAPVGATVTLTPAAKSGYRFYEWTYGQNSQKPPITNNAFTMPKGAMSVEANYDEIKTIKILGTAYDFTVHEPLYFTTVDGAAVALTEGDLEKLYNIKLAIVEEIPTVYLKGAELESTNGTTLLRNGTNVSHFDIFTESESSIAGNNNAIYLDRCDLTFKGSEKLSILGNTDNSADAWGGGSSIEVYHYDAVNDPAESVIVRTITFDQNANVYIRSGGTNTAGIWGEIHHLKDGARTSGNIDTKVVFVGGSALEVESNSNIFYTGINFSVSNYENWAAVCGETKQTATGYDGTSQLRTQKYFKLAPGYIVTIDGGTSASLSNGGRAPVGAIVTVNPIAAEDGKGFAYWTSAELLGEGKNYDSAYTFTMLGKPVAVAASYGETASVSISGTARTFVKGGKPVCLLTDPATGVETLEGANEQNYNIMLSFVDNLPTVTLKGATITTGAGVHAIRNGAGISNLIVVVESASTITSGGRGFYLLNSDMTIKGPGKLSVLTQDSSYSGGSGIVMENTAKSGIHTLTFDNANVVINANGNGTSCIYEYRRDINVNINGGTVELIATYRGWDSYVTEGVDGEDAKSANNIPTITGDWTAIQGDSTTYWGYSSGTLLNQRYFKVEPKVVEVTITWGAMSFTYTGSVWNVETLKWEGRWEPTVSDDSEAAGMDGYDPALASNQIKVVNSGTVTVNVSFRFNPDTNFGNDYGTVNGAFVTRKPYYLSNWDEVDSSAYPNLYAKAYFWATRNGTDVSVSYNGETSISGMAAKLKEVFDEYPDNSNMRIINITAVARSFLSEQTEDCVFMESGVAALADWVNEFLGAYKTIGGKLDAIYSDLEYINGFYWELYNKQYLEHEAKDEDGNPITIPANTNVYRNIIENDNYQTKVRRQLEERGFKFETNPNMADFGELYSLYPNAGSEYTDSKRIWDTVIRDLLCDYLNEAIYVPLQEHYPNAYFTDYQSRDTYGWMKLMNENAYNTYLGGNTQKAGTHSSYNAYNYAPQWVTKSEKDTSYKKPVSYNGAVFEDNAFHMTQWETNNFKAMYAATDSKKIEITLTYYDYAIKMREEWRDNQDATSSGTPYHIEGYLHAGLLDPEFGGYVIESEVENETYPSSTGSYSDALGIISNIMKTLDAVVGYSDRKPIETPLNWNDSFILSGMYANGRNVWRITPDTITGVSDKGEFLDNTEGGQIVFKNKGQTITFPQGSIIEEPVDISVGTCGYWVETPADVMPIVTNVENRYEQYPAYVETFDNDNYTVGEAFSSQHSHTWELGDSSVTIQQNGDDKFLAIQGNATLNNVKLPEYITAGDNYAKQQAWELSFKLDTLPTGDAEVILLSAASDSGSNTDGGFRVYNNGQLDYSTASGYQAFNITLDANTEYTVKRVFNFRTANSFTCSYYVYAADGSELAKAEDVVISSLSLPVQKIGISTANFDTNTLYVDDYKLYATGVTTDLEVYNADTGIQVNASVLREDNTAYRLSWMNASDAIKYYNVVATYEDGTKEIVKSIKMLPGCDGVNTGIVKVDDGKSVTISLEETDTKVPDAGDNAGDDGSSNGSNSANGEDTTITLTRSQEADAYLYLSSGYVAVFDERKTLGTVTVTINAITPAQEGGNA